MEEFLKLMLESNVPNYDLTELNHEAYNGLIICSTPVEVLNYCARWGYTITGVAESPIVPQKDDYLRHFRYAIVIFTDQGEKIWFHVADYWLDSLLEALGSDVRYSKD